MNYKINFFWGGVGMILVVQLVSYLNYDLVSEGSIPTFNPLSATPYLIISFKKKKYF